MTTTVAVPRRRGRRDPMNQVYVSLPDDVLMLVDRHANIYMQDRSQVLRDLVTEALRNKGKLKPIEASL